jgi:hypothetical protein
MIPLICATLKSQIHRDRKQNEGYQGSGIERNRESLFNLGTDFLFGMMKRLRK